MTFRILSLISLSLVVLIFTIDGGPPVVQAHGHSHEDNPPNPAFKYSRAANEKIEEDEILEEDIVDLPPQRGPSPGHGHSHGGHGHSHGGHGHSHGSAQPELTPDQREKARQKLHKNWDDDAEDEETGGSGSVFWNAIFATLLISAAPFVILFFIPLDNSAENQWLLKITLSFASGGLLGDAFLHLIPHAMMASSGEESDSGHGHSHSHGHSHGSGEAHEPHNLSVGLWTLAGIIAFLCVEKLVRIYSGGHSHSHAAPAVVPDEEKKDEKKEEKDEKKEEKEEKEEKKEETKEEKKEDDENEEEDKPAEPKTEENAVLPEEKEIKVAGYLNLAADAFHNFTDGLAIGASFMAGNSVGYTTTFSILFHEIPHEIGDYAILIQSGVPPMKAIFLQSFTALAALAGCLVALFAHGAGQAAAASVILPFTAGGFIYIATVSVIPELLEGTSFMQSIYEIVALLAGVGMMVIISFYE